VLLPAAPVRSNGLEIVERPLIFDLERAIYLDTAQHRPLAHTEAALILEYGLPVGFAIEDRILQNIIPMPRIDLNLVIIHILSIRFIYEQNGCKGAETVIRVRGIVRVSDGMAELVAATR
jgi:hypothetical protein